MAKYRYLSDGSQTYRDIPAGDLSDEVWELLTEEQKAWVAASPFYEEIKAERATGRSTAKTVPEEE